MAENLNTVFEYTEDIRRDFEVIPRGWRTISPDGARCGNREKIVATGKTMDEAQKLCENNEILAAGILAAFKIMGF